MIGRSPASWALYTLKFQLGAILEGIQGYLEATCQMKQVNIALTSSMYDPELDTFEMQTDIGLTYENLEQLPS